MPKTNEMNLIISAYDDDTRSWEYNKLWESKNMFKIRRIT